ncbi:hypothetical protein FRX31_013689 [Thalictrum thalictroides]|uniref:Uncharacterized protein n=1 Tax=Thalictrum thalictroides TaxID=46969 RepID=A0A7J6WJT8_THATH|nr:hypothetical protein FRX31_013689 [Thalictrum thalictroides]
MVFNNAGSCSLNGLDDEKGDVQDGKEKGQPMIELDEKGSMSFTSTKKRQVSSVKRQHGKKDPFMEEMMNGIFKGVNERHDKLTNVVHPFSLESNYVKV